MHFMAGHCLTNPWTAVPDWNPDAGTAMPDWTTWLPEDMPMPHYVPAFRHLHMIFTILKQELHHQQQSLDVQGPLPAVWTCTATGNPFHHHQHQQYGRAVQGYPLPPPAEWACRAYPFQLPAVWTCRVTGCIHFHSQQNGLEGCIPFPEMGNQ